MLELRGATFRVVGLPDLPRHTVRTIWVHTGCYQAVENAGGGIGGGIKAHRRYAQCF